MTAVDDRLCWVVVVVVMLVLGSGAGETGGALHGHPAARLLSISRPVPQFRRPDRGLLTDKMMQQTAQVGQRESFRGEQIITADRDIHEYGYTQRSRVRPPWMRGYRYIRQYLKLSLGVSLAGRS